MENVIMEKDRERHVLDMIWEKSQLLYMSDLSDIKNYPMLYLIVSEISESQYPKWQWEEAYNYIFRDKTYIGIDRESILLELQKENRSKYPRKGIFAVIHRLKTGISAIWRKDIKGRHESVSHFF